FDGGALYVGNSGAVQLSNVSIVSNTAVSGNGGGISAGGTGSVTLRNTLVARNPGQSTPDCAANTRAMVSAGYNLIENSAGCHVAKTSGDLFNVAAFLNPLADNGGTTQTESLQPASPAIDGGNPAGCVDDVGAAITIDQRGLARSPAGDDCD